MSGVSWEASELNKLAVDLRNAPLKADAKIGQIVAKGALNVKEEARQLAAGIRHAPAYPASIGFDLLIEGHALVAEIGPDKDKRQGALGNILEYGTSKNAPLPHLGPALDREGPRFVAAVAAIVDDLL